MEYINAYIMDIALDRFNSQINDDFSFYEDDSIYEL